MGTYSIDTTPEEDARIEELKLLFGEKTATKLFKKIIMSDIQFVIKNVD